MEQVLVLVFRRLHEELKGVGGSNRLASQVASCTGKALRVLAEKAEYMAATGQSSLSMVSLFASELTQYLVQMNDFVQEMSGHVRLCDV